MEAKCGVCVVVLRMQLNCRVVFALNVLRNEYRIVKTSTTYTAKVFSQLEFYL
jgi:hypothetical protein